MIPWCDFRGTCHRPGVCVLERFTSQSIRQICFRGVLGACLVGSVPTRPNPTPTVCPPARCLCLWAMSFMRLDNRAGDMSSQFMISGASNSRTVKLSFMRGRLLSWEVETSRLFPRFARVFSPTELTRCWGVLISPWDPTRLYASIYIELLLRTHLSEVAEEKI